MNNKTNSLLVPIESEEFTPSSNQRLQSQAQNIGIDTCSLDLYHTNQPQVTNSSFKTLICLVEVEALDPPTEALQKTIDSMQSRGIKMLYGRWLIEGAPRVLLFDTGSAWNRLDEWKGDLWSVAGIPAPPGDNETNETIVFGYLVAWFLGEV